MLGRRKQYYFANHTQIYERAGLSSFESMQLRSKESSEGDESGAVILRQFRFIKVISQKAQIGIPQEFLRLRPHFGADKLFRIVLKTKICDHFIIIISVWSTTQ